MTTIRETLFLLSVTFCIFAGSLIAADAPPAKTDSGEVIETSDGVRFGIWPKKPDRPAPTLFVLAGALEDALSSPYFRQAGEFLRDDGVVCVSIDLPCHGKEIRHKEGGGLSGWRSRVNKGEDFVAETTTRLKKVLDHLICSGITDPERIAALGTSRGGFIAMHFAAVDARVKQVMGFSPVANLAQLSEFRGAESNALVQKLALEKQADVLAGRTIWLVIGDRDARVGTDSVIQFARAVTTASLAKKISPQVELHVIAEPKGHTVPAGYAKIGADWLRARLIAKPAP